MKLTPEGREGRRGPHPRPLPACREGSKDLYGDGTLAPHLPFVRPRQGRIALEDLGGRLAEAHPARQSRALTTP